MTSGGCVSFMLGITQPLPQPMKQTGPLCPASDAGEYRTPSRETSSMWQMRSFFVLFLFLNWEYFVLTLSVTKSLSVMRQDGGEAARALNKIIWLLIC